jgi:WD40 repeat protein
MRCEKIEIEEDNRHIKQILSVFNYKCSKCLNDVSLDNYADHNKVCSEDLMSCQKGCGALMREMYLQTHYKLFCPDATVKCQNCESEVKRSDIKSITDSRFKELEDELKRKDEIIHNLRSSRIIQKDNKDLIIDNIHDQYSNKEIGELCKINLKQELENPTNLANNLYIESFSFKSNNYLLLAITTGDVLIYDISSKKIIKKIQLHKDNFTDLLHFTDHQGEEVILSSSFDSTIAQFKISQIFTEENLNINRHRTKVPVTSMMMSEDKDIIVAGDVAGNIKLLSLEKYEEIIPPFKVHNSRIVFIKYLDKESLISYAKDRTLAILDLNNFQIKKSIKVEHALTSCVYLENLSNFYFSDDKGNLYIYDRVNSNIKPVYKSNPNAQVSNYKLYSYQLNMNESLLFLLSPLDGIKFFLCSQVDVNFFLDRKINDITTCSILNKSIHGVGMNNNNISNNISNNIVIDDILSKSQVKLIFSRKSGEINFMELD